MKFFSIGLNIFVEVTSTDKFCAEDCDIHYRCFAQRSKVAAQTWDGTTEFYGHCGDDGQFLTEFCTEAIRSQCQHCYPDSPCSSLTGNAEDVSTAATTSTMDNLVNLHLETGGNP